MFSAYDCNGIYNRVLCALLFSQIEGLDLIVLSCETDKLVTDKENILIPMESETQPHAHLLTSR